VLVDADGNKTPLEGLTFLMPAEDVQVELTVEQIVYRVTFVVDGEIVHQADYLMGEEIILPTAPTKENDETYSYRFIGWTPEVQSMAFGEERELVYEAKFQEKLLDISQFEQRSTMIRDIAIIGISAFVVVLILIVVLIVLLRRRKKRRLAKRSAKAAPAPEADAASQNPPDDTAPNASVSNDGTSDAKDSPNDTAEDVSNDASDDANNTPNP